MMRFSAIATLAIAAFAGVPGGAVAQEAGAPEGAGIAQKALVCSACHGPLGASIDPKYPIIGGQTQYYLYLQLKDFKAGRRENAEMKPVVEALASEDLMPLAVYFSEQRWPAVVADPARIPDPARVAAGEVAAGAGECSQCHLGGYNGASGVPRLAGQHVAYLEKTMLDYRSKARNNDPAMSSLMATYADADIAALAQFLASLSVQERAGSVEIQ